MTLRLLRRGALNQTFQDRLGALRAPGFTHAAALQQASGQGLEALLAERDLLRHEPCEHAVQHGLSVERVGVG